LLLVRQAAEASFTQITLRRPDGALLATSMLRDKRKLAADSDANAAEDPAWPALVRQAVLSRSVVIGDAMLAEGGNMMVVPLLVPILRGGEPVLMVDMQMPVGRLITALRRAEATKPTDGEAGLALLIDRTGHVIAASHTIASLTGQAYPSDAIPTAIFSATLPLNALPGWRLIYQQDHGSTGLSARTVITLAAIIAVACGLALAALFSRRMARWLQQLVQLTRSIAVGHEALPLASGGMLVAELDELRQSLLRADAVLRRRAAAERMALREARTGHELLVSVVNGTAESIHVKDLDLRYVLVNRAALHDPDSAGGEPRAEWQVLGRQTADLFPPQLARRIESADRRVLASGKMTSFEHQYTRTGDKQARFLAMTIAPWQNAEGRVVGVVSVSRDVTQGRRSEIRLRKLQAELLRVTRLSAMGAMASGLAHELNQPLAAATNYLNAGSRLLERSAAGDERALLQVRGAVSDAAQQMLRAGSIVRRLRDFVERGEVELQPENVAELLRETCDLATTDGHTDGIAFTCTVADGIGSMLVDRTQIGQVLFNLIRNAAEAIQGADYEPAPSQADPLGRIAVSARIDDDGATVIEVTDTGPGLAPGIAERLFQPFVSSKRTGMGIGLAICRTIIEGHGGTLEALANPGGGMIFRISLPALLPQGVAA
jgi:C4-dicarboxylate-specific signal transduction histidine kinase